jgi:hypothetical protein
MDVILEFVRTHMVGFGIVATVLIFGGLTKLIRFPWGPGW